MTSCKLFVAVPHVVELATAGKRQDARILISKKKRKKEKNMLKRKKAFRAFTE